MFCPNHPDTTADQTCAACAKSFCRDCVVEIGGQSYCAPCKEELVRDLKSGVVSHGEIGPLATRWSRFAAQLIDGLVLGLGFVIIFALIGVLTARRISNTPDFSRGIASRWGLGYVLFLAGAFVYEWKMVARSGQTLGKRALGIQVVAEDGRPLGNHAWKRPLYRYTFTFMSCVGFIDPLMIFSERNRTLHDRLAKTLVIQARR